MITHDLVKFLERPYLYRQMERNPNPNDTKPSFLCLTRFTNIKSNKFSKPYQSWHLSKNDEQTIEKLEKEKPSE